MHCPVACIQNRKQSRKCVACMGQFSVTLSLPAREKSSWQFVLHLRVHAKENVKRRGSFSRGVPAPETCRCLWTREDCASNLSSTPRLPQPTDPLLLWSRDRRPPPLSPISRGMVGPLLPRPRHRPRLGPHHGAAGQDQGLFAEEELVSCLPSCEW